MEDEGFICQFFEYLKNLEGELNWINVKSQTVIGEHELQLIATIGSGFDRGFNS